MEVLSVIRNERNGDKVLPPKYREFVENLHDSLEFPREWISRRPRRGFAIAHGFTAKKSAETKDDAGPGAKGASPRCARSVDGNCTPTTRSRTKAAGERIDDVSSASARFPGTLKIDMEEYLNNPRYRGDKNGKGGRCLNIYSPFICRGREGAVNERSRAGREHRCLRERTISWQGLPPPWFHGTHKETLEERLKNPCHRGAAGTSRKRGGCAGQK